MEYPSSTANKELLEEISTLKQRILELERSEIERGRAEEDLRASEKKYRSVIENIQDVFYRSDDKGLLLMGSPSGAGMFGYGSIDEMVGLPLDAFWPDPAKRKKLLDQIMRRGNVKGFEAVLKKKDGTLFDVSFTTHYYYDDQGNFLGTEGIIRDITERKKAEITLFESESKFRALAENSTAVIFVIQEEKYIYANPAFVTITGYSFEDLSSMCFWDLISPDMRELVRTRGIARQNGEDVPPRYDLKFITKSGEEKYGSFSATLIEFQGKPAILGSVLDITERRRMEDALKQSEEKYRKIFENAVEGFYQSTPDGRFLNVNPALARMMGFASPGEMIAAYTDIGKQHYVDPRDRAFFKGLLEQDGIIQAFETQLYRKDGRAVWVSISGRAVCGAGGDVLYYEGTIEDITFRKQAERALQESEEKYRNVVENSLVGFYIIQDDLFKFVNKRFCEIIGYSHDELVNGTHVMNVIHPDDRVLVGRNLSKRLAGETSPVEYDFRAVRKNGEVISVKIIGSSILYNGRFAATGTLVDITREKLLEAQFLQSQKMEAIGSLASGIAHDLNNLLTGIKMHAYLGKSALDWESPAYIKLKSIEDIVDSAANLTKQFLGFARGGKYETQPTDLNDVIEKTLSFFSRTRKEITIGKEYAAGLWSVNADRGQMEQVFLNLFVNARHAMPGGGNMVISTENVVLDEAGAGPYLSPPGRYVKARVTDNGTGIDEAIKARIFDPFFTTKERGIGTGLGLASVYGIVKNHEGFITVESEAGKGSTFSIFLPATDKEAVKGKRASAKLLTGKEAILLVDDEKEILNLTSAVFEALGYRVYTAEGGGQAIETYKTCKDTVAAVVLDLIMPGMDGEETFYKLREINPGIKVILASGYGMNDVIKRVMKKGCNAFIQKPYDVHMLSVKIREILDN